MDRDKAIRAAKLTIGGMSSKDNSFETSTQDASHIFGDGSVYKFYKHPESGGYIQVLQKKSGPASVIGLEVPEEFRGKGIGQALQAEAMKNHPSLMGQVSSKAAATTAYRLGRRPYGNPSASLDDVYKGIDENSSINLMTPDAQPKSKGGALELARHATAVGRAGGQVAPSKYMPNVPRAVHADGGKVAFQQGNHPDVPDVVYHGTNRDIQSFDPNAERNYDIDPRNPASTDTGWFGKGHYFAPKPKRASYYAEEAARRSQGQGAQVYPVHLSMKNPFVVHMKDTDSGATTLDKALSNTGVPMHSRGYRMPSEQTAALIDMGHDGVIAKREGKTEEIVAFHPNQIKSAIGNQGTFDPKDPDITKADGGRVGYGNGGKSLGLHSKAAQVIRNQPQAKGSVDQLLAMVSKTKGVKPAELTNAGRPAGGTMSKEELAKHFEDALPKVDVERIGGRDSNGFPQYEKYTLPGGENYREHLLHLSDEREPPKALHRVMGAFPRDFDSEEGARQYIRQLDTLRNTPGMEGIAESLTRYPAIYQRENGRSTNPNDFKSSHWDTPNVLAHVRMSDRDNGETLHVHELQSDWGQEGRENGFHDPEKPFEVVNKKTKEVVSRHPDYSSMWDAYRTHPDSDNLTYGDVRDEKPPQGPYVGNTQQWTDLALKHIMMEAAKGGYKRVVFSPGEANADLYGQRKEVSKLEFLKSNDSGEAGILSGFTPNGYYSSQHDVESHADLPKLIGKENAANLLAQPPTPSPDKGEDRYTHTLQGPLQVGGHGMVDYYKNYVNQGAMKLLQQHDQSAKPESYDLPEGYKGFALPVTDTSRESILKNGFQAFQRGGEVRKATGGQVMGYVPMATLPVSRLAVARAPVQQQQAPVGRFSDSLSSLMDTVEGFKKKPDTAVGSPSAASEGHAPQGMSEAATAAYGKLVDAYGQPLTINSAYRDPEKNEEVGGAKGSQHTHGNAYDIDVSNMPHEDRVALANLAWDSGFRGIGFYDNSMHFDVGDPRGWGPSHSRDSIPEWAQPFTQERYGYSDGGIAMDDNNQDTSGGNNVESLSLARSLRNIGSGGGDDRVQGLFDKIAAGQQQAQKAYEMAHSNGEFDDFKIGDTFVYKHSKYPTPMKITGFSVSRAESFPQRKRIYNNHVPVLEMEDQDAGKKVNNYPVEAFQENRHKYDFVSGKPRAVKAGGGMVSKALALTRVFTRDGKSATSALKSKGK